MAQPHKQLALGQALSSIVAAADINPMAMSRLDSMLTLFCFEFGACGRIFNTAIPSAYTRCVCVCGTFTQCQFVPVINNAANGHSELSGRGFLP